MKCSWEQRGWRNISCGELRASDLPELLRGARHNPCSQGADPEQGRSRAGASLRPPEHTAAAQVAPRPAAPGRGPGGLQVVLLSREAALRQEIPAGAPEGALGNACIYSSQVCKAHQLRGRGSTSRA